MRRADSLLRSLVMGFPVLLIGAEDAPAPSIRAVMHKEYTVTRAPYRVIGRELKAETPDWDALNEASRTFTDLASLLGKNAPRRGDRETWQKHLAAHLADVKAVGDAVQRRDARALRAAHERVATSCNACHAAHRARGAR